MLHCPWNVAGNPQRLAEAERELGLRSHAVALRGHEFKYPVDTTLLEEDDRAYMVAFKRSMLLWRALRRADVVHYNFGEQIFPNDPAKPVFGKGIRAIYRRMLTAYNRAASRVELPLLRVANRAIVVTYQGDDARQGDYCRATFAVSAASEVESEYYTPESDAHKRIQIARVAKYADCIYALNPDLLHVLPARAKFLPYATVDLRDWVPARKQSDSRKLRVLHAPTHRRVKGTRHVIAAVDRLRNVDGLDFEFVLVEGLSNSEARGLYERADLLVDQLLVGWYGGLAVEFMALGKPVISYIREEDLQFLPPEMRSDIPVINATPDSLYEVLKIHLTEQKSDLARLGELGRKYVERWHDPVKVAATLKADYERILQAPAIE